MHDDGQYFGVENNRFQEKTGEFPGTHTGYQNMAVKKEVSSQVGNRTAGN
jgi:hypothetical protein